MTNKSYIVGFLILLLVLTGVAGISGQIVVQESSDLKKIPEMRLEWQREEEGRDFHIRWWLYRIESKAALKLPKPEGIDDSLVKPLVLMVCKTTKPLEKTKEEDLVSFVRWSEKKGKTGVTGIFLELANGKRYIHVTERTFLGQEK